MMRNKYIVYILIVFVLGSCVKPFDPELNDNTINKFVVDGSISSVEGWQTLNVSQTSSTSQAQFIPVKGCIIQVLDDQGQVFQMEEYEEGNYRVWMNNSDLIPGRAYKVKIITPSGEILESTFDIMPEGSEVGNVYYEVEDQQTNNPEYVKHGIQFYTDFSAAEDASRYFRWRLTETWEYRADYPLRFFYDENGVNEVIPEDSSKMFCWRTDVIQDVYTLSTINLANNSLERYPLNYVLNSTKRLKVLYSLLVEQIALSENAYNYWDKLRLNISQQGGLYTTQPLNVKGNIVNTTHPEKEVLGFFQASTVTSKRIFVEPVEGLELEIIESCNINVLRFGLAELGPTDYPAYLLEQNGTWSNNTLSKNCVDCTRDGGVAEKPDYWPN